MATVHRIPAPTPPTPPRSLAGSPAGANARFTRVERPAHPRSHLHLDPQPARWGLHRSLVLAGFLSLLAALVLHTGLQPARMASPEVMPFLPALAGAALLAWRARPVFLLGSALATSLLPLMVLLVFGALPALANPLGGSGHTTLLFLVLALALALPAGVQGYRLARRGAALPALRGGGGTAAGLYAIAVTMLMAGVMVTAGGASERAASQAAAGAGYDFAPDATAHVAMEGFVFAPAETRLDAGVITEIVVENRDPELHTFTYAAGGQVYSHDVAGGATARFLVRLDDPGQIPYWCAPHSSGPDGARSGMVGTLAVA